MTGKMKTRIEGSVVSPRSIKAIAREASLVRGLFGLENKKFFPIVKIYEMLYLLLPNADFDVWEEDEMGDDHGKTFPNKNLICLRNDVYVGADNGEARDRFTMCHELGHLIMHREIAFSRIDPSSPPKIYQNSEWQADVFASHLLMPGNLLCNYSDISKVMTDFGVSFDAAKVRMP